MYWLPLCLYSRKHLLPVWLASTRIAHHPLGTMRNDVSELTRFPALPVYYEDPMGKRANRLLQFISLWIMSCSFLSSQLGYCSLCWAPFSSGIVLVASTVVKNCRSDSNSVVGKPRFPPFFYSQMCLLQRGGNLGLAGKGFWVPLKLFMISKGSPFLSETKPRASILKMEMKLSSWPRPSMVTGCFCPNLGCWGSSPCC